MVKINDEMLDRLGTYFVYHAVYDNYGITFENFVSVGYEAYLTYSELDFKTPGNRSFIYKKTFINLV